MRSLSSVVSLIVVLGAAAAARAQERVDVRVDNPVTSAASPESVRFTLANEKSTPAFLFGSKPWRIVRDGKIVFEPPSFSLPTLIPALFSRLLEWNKRDTAGNPVSPGTYTVVVGKVTDGSSTYDVERTITLTPSVPATQANRFPLAVGNRWTYANQKSPSQTRTTKITAQSSGGWFRIEDAPFLHDCTPDGWVRMTMASSPQLVHLGHSSKGDVVHTLVAFQRSVGSHWNTDSIGTLKVISTTDTIVTPAGTFANCYRVKVVAPPQMGGFKADYWFAPEVGLVQFTTGSGIQRLVAADLMCNDGKIHKIGKQ